MNVKNYNNGSVRFKETYFKEFHPFNDMVHLKNESQEMMRSAMKYY